MTKKTKNINRMFNIFYFLLVYFIYAFYRIPMMLFFNIKSMLNVLTTALLFGTLLVIAYMMPKHKIFYHKGNYILLLGIFLWISFGMLFSFTGLTLGGSVAIRELLSLTAFSFILVLALRIVTIYDMRIQLLKIALAIISFWLITAYITHFDNFAFLNPKTFLNIMNNAGRYRNAFGLGHPNGTGVNCIYYFLMTHLLKALLEEKGSSRKRFFKKKVLQEKGSSRKRFLTISPTISFIDTSR